MTKMTPFRIIDNLYFIGTREASCHLIDTGDGLILIDTGYSYNVETILESMNALGFDPADIKIILHSHGHYDHTDATAGILEYAKDAKTYLRFEDKKYIKGFDPDFDIQDGDAIRLGNTEILCLFTPGHTEGTVSFFWDVYENGVKYRAAMFGGAGVNQLKRDFLLDHGLSFELRDLFFASVERLSTYDVDVFIGNHSWQNHTSQKFEQIQAGEVDSNPFINPKEWKRFLAKTKTKMLAIIEEENGQAE